MEHVVGEIGGEPLAFTLSHYLFTIFSMAKVTPYLHFNGNAQEAFDFYKSVFGGEFTTIMKMKDVPGSGASGAEGEKIMNITLPLGKDHALMASDVPEHLLKEKVFTVGNNLDLSVSLDTKEEAELVFAGLSAGGVVEMSMADGGGNFGMLVDKFGINWMVSFP
jgi:PhnB protein